MEPSRDPGPLPGPTKAPRPARTSPSDLSPPGRTSPTRSLSSGAPIAATPRTVCPRAYAPRRSRSVRRPLRPDPRPTRTISGPSGSVSVHARSCSSVRADHNATRSRTTAVASAAGNRPSRCGLRAAWMTAVSVRSRADAWARSAPARPDRAATPTPAAARSVAFASDERDSRPFRVLRRPTRRSGRRAG